MTGSELIDGLGEIHAARAKGDKAGIEAAFRKLEERVESVKALRDFLTELGGKSSAPGGADGIVYWVEAECERSTVHSLRVTLGMMAEDPQFSLLKRWLARPAEISTNAHSNRVDWNESDPSYYPNKEAIADAQKVGTDCEIAALQTLNLDKLKKLLRSPEGRPIRYMSRMAPPRGRVHRDDWQKYLKSFAQREQLAQDRAERMLEDFPPE